MTNEPDRREFVLPSTFYIHFDEIDPQHEKLIDIINDCADRLVDGVLDDFQEPFEEFTSRLVAHFNHEEDHMRDLGYSGLEWHADHHQDCLNRLRKLIDEMESKGYADMHDLRVCFHDIVHDIAHADLKFGEFLEGLGLTERKR